MKIKWDIVHDADDENGVPTVWSTTVGGRFWWICLNSKGEYTCEIKRGGEFSCVMTCKSLSSAKRWVSINHWKYEGD